MSCAEVSLHNWVGWAVARGGVQMCGASMEMSLITGGVYSGGRELRRPADDKEIAAPV